MGPSANIFGLFRGRLSPWSTFSTVQLVYRITVCYRIINRTASRLRWLAFSKRHGDMRSNVLSRLLSIQGPKRQTITCVLENKVSKALARIWLAHKELHAGGWWLMPEVLKSKWTQLPGARLHMHGPCKVNLSTSFWKTPGRR